MFSRALVVITLAVAAVASPTGRSDVCSTGTVSCCNQIAPANQVPTNDVLAALLALNIQDLDIPVGVECTPLSVLGGASAGTCNAQSACCDHTSASGAVAIGCSPINGGL